MFHTVKCKQSQRPRLGAIVFALNTIKTYCCYSSSTLQSFSIDSTDGDVMVGMNWHLRLELTILTSQTFKRGASRSVPG